MSIELKDGTEVEDRQFDRLIQFDERSRAFNIRALVWGKKPRSYDWRIQTPFSSIKEKRAPVLGSL